MGNLLCAGKRQDAKAVFIWENFGPIHLDRVEAVVKLFGSSDSAVGVEIYSKSDTYEWNSEDSLSFQKITLFKIASDNKEKKVNFLRRYLATIRICLRYPRATYFVCHYEHPSTFLLAMTLRLIRRRVAVMNDSKFDDYQRSLFKEFFKFLMYLPYKYAIASPGRSFDYLRFLGINPSNIHTPYNSLNLDRLRLQSGLLQDRVIEFENRHFVIVARFVAKKNIATALQAYAIYRSECLETPRELHIAGSGPLEAELRALADELGISSFITWYGFIQSDEVCKLLGKSLALLLLSTEEQFGNVVIEAMALGLPCILSTQIGARDRLMKSGVTGFLVESDNASGAAFFMALIASDRERWQGMGDACREIVMPHDTSNFAQAASAIASR